MPDEIMLTLDRLRTDGGTQSRAFVDPAVVADYAAELADGAVFPPVVAFYDGSDYWLADGFHRLAAARQAGQPALAVDLRQGTQRDAVLFSVGANAHHGLRRSNQDKRRAVATLLADPEWAQWSDREIARRAGVGSSSWVGKLRAELVPDASSQRRGADGRLIDVSRIGSKPSQRQLLAAFAQSQPDDVLILVSVEKAWLAFFRHEWLREQYQLSYGSYVPSEGYSDSAHVYKFDQAYVDVIRQSGTPLVLTPVETLNAALRELVERCRSLPIIHFKPSKVADLHVGMQIASKEKVVATITELDAAAVTVQLGPDVTARWPLGDLRDVATVRQRLDSGPTSLTYEQTQYAARGTADWLEVRARLKALYAPDAILFTEANSAGFIALGEDARAAHAILNRDQPRALYVERPDGPVLVVLSSDLLNALHAAGQHVVRYNLWSQASAAAALITELLAQALAAPRPPVETEPRTSPAEDPLTVSAPGDAPRSFTIGAQVITRAGQVGHIKALIGGQAKVSVSVDGQPQYSSTYPLSDLRPAPDPQPTVEAEIAALFAEDEVTVEAEASSLIPRPGVFADLAPLPWSLAKRQALDAAGMPVAAFGLGLDAVAAEVVALVNQAASPALPDELLADLRLIQTQIEKLERAGLNWKMFGAVSPLPEIQRVVAHFVPTPVPEPVDD